MGNQQERSLTWLAVVIECEGSISCQIYTLPDGRVRLTPFACVVNSDRLILEETIRIFELIGVKYRELLHSSPTNLQCSTIRIDGMKPIKILLEAILPYLIGDKKRNAKNILEFIASREARGMQRNELGHIRRAEYTKYEIDLVTQYRTHKLAKSSETICSAPNVIG